MLKAKIFVTLRNGVKDIQGEAVAKHLVMMGHESVDAVRIGKYIELDLKSTDRTKATEEAKKMCEELLANTVIEKYSIRIVKR